MTRKPLFDEPAYAVLEGIKSLQDALGMPPTILELKDWLGVGSTRTVLRYLKQAEARGLIQRWPGARGIRVLRGK